jgi:omega-amidase
MRVYAVQMDQAWEDKSANYAKAEAMLEKESPGPGSLIVLPELFPTGYSINMQLTTADEPQKTEAFLRQLAQKYKSWVLAGNAQQKTSDKGGNVAVTFKPDGEKVDTFTKLHPVKYYNEDKAYAAGEGIHVFPCQEFTLSPFICYDLRFPEVFRAAAFKGANLFVVIANWPKIRIDHWEWLLRSRAVENQAYTIGVNRIGNDPNLEYPGHSLILDPQGRSLAEAESEETILSADLDLQILLDWRETFPALKDARSDFLPKP